jgi:hypothetical protein
LLLQELFGGLNIGEKMSEVGITTIVIGGLGLMLAVAVGYIIFGLRAIRPDSEDSTTQRELDREKETRLGLQGELRQATDRIFSLNAQLESLKKENNLLSGRIVKFETTEEQRRLEHERRLEQADKQRQSFEKQEDRILQREREAAEAAEAARDRMWNDHEVKVISKMVELCQAPEYQMPIYTNKNIPSELVDKFGTRFKPDVLIQLENQFIVFDAKHSKSEQLSTYIASQVKSFAVKADSSQLIYPAVFFVVPTPALADLKQTVFNESGYRVYIVGVESLPVLLAMFKRVEGYALADKLDPAERENIVTSLASMHQHISFRNASELLLTKIGVDTLRKNELRLSSDMQAEVKQKLKQRIPVLSTSDTKKLMANYDNPQQLMEEMISPKAMISGEDFDAPEFIATGKIGHSKSTQKSE